MAATRPTTIAAYIAAAPAAARPHLRKLHAILETVAPDAQQAIKWGHPFFVEPRFLFAFSATKAHVNFAPSQAALQAFAGELADLPTTLNYLQLRYDRPLPADLVRRIAQWQQRAVAARTTDAFW